MVTVFRTIPQKAQNYGRQSISKTMSDTKIWNDAINLLARAKEVKEMIALDYHTKSEDLVLLSTIRSTKEALFHVGFSKSDAAKPDNQKLVQRHAETLLESRHEGCRLNGEPMSKANRYLTPLNPVLFHPITSAASSLSNDGDNTAVSTLGTESFCSLPDQQEVCRCEPEKGRERTLPSALEIALRMLGKIEGFREYRHRGYASIPRERTKMFINYWQTNESQP